MMYIVLITIIGAVLRFLYPNWDAGGRLHPDEALIVNGALSIKFFSNLFPGFHDYNGLSVYILRIVMEVFGVYTPDGVTTLARGISAFFSTASIALLYTLGQRLWNRRIGLLAAILFCFSPLSIQLAHFYTTESILIFLLILLLLAMEAFSRLPNVSTVLAMAIPTGLLLGTKNTSLLFLPLPFATLLLTHKSKSLWSVIFFLVLCGVSFFISSPFSVVDFHGFITRYRYLTDVVSGSLLMDWTLQFQKTNGLFWIPNIGIGFGVASLLGLVGLFTYLFQKNKRHIHILIVLWTIFFTIFLSFTYLKFIRYAAPLLPSFSLFSAWLLWQIQSMRYGKIFVGLFVGIHMLLGFMFFSIYLTPHTTLQAGDWIEKNIPTTSSILIEEWNSIIRFSQPTLSAKKFTLTSFNFYTLPDSQKKHDQLKSIVDHTDYIILESPKVKHTIYRLRQEYPYANAFYENLDSGVLGFEKVAEFASYPRLGPFSINDETFEETFTVFDHPTVRIYKRTSP